MAPSVTLADPTTLTYVLDLRGVTPGLWNVVVTNPNKEYWTLTDGFTVIGFVHLPLIVR